MFAAAATVAAGVALSVYGVMAAPHIQPPVPPAGHELTTRQQPSIRPGTSVQPNERWFGDPAPGAAVTVPTPPPVIIPGAAGPTSTPLSSTAVIIPGAAGQTSAPLASAPLTSAPVSIPGAAGPTSASFASAPVSIAVPALEISSDLGPARGLKPDGTVDDAPLSGPTWSLPWWYDDGPAPGQPGSAVILGHVDSAVGAGHLGVFYNLGDLQPGQQVVVTLADGSATRWVVASTSLYLDGQFPDAIVYDRSGPAVLRLVTCGGSFDWQTHEYDSAIVVTARPAGPTFVAREGVQAP